MVTSGENGEIIAIEFLLEQGMKCSGCDDCMIPYKYTIYNRIGVFKMDGFQGWSLNWWCSLLCVPKALNSIPRTAKQF